MGHRDRPKRPPRSAYITAEGARAMRAELEELVRVERPRVTQAVADAAAMGDRSENAEYIYGKKRLREIDSRLRFLTKRLEQITIVAEPPSDHSRVFFGAYVTVEDDDGDEHEYRIVGPDETDARRSWISMDSPVAKALMGKADGAEVIVRRPKGAATLTIVGIRYE